MLTTAQKAGERQHRRADEQTGPAPVGADPFVQTDEAEYDERRRSRNHYNPAVCAAATCEDDDRVTTAMARKGVASRRLAATNSAR